MKNKDAFKTAKMMCSAGYWDIAILFLKKLMGDNHEHSAPPRYSVRHH
ncbi:hypothetical protein ACE5F0_05925 [Klebsiella pneumoniae subsp. pneumoniae]